MIAIVTTIFLSISVLLFSFLGFAPNLHRIVESDYMRRAYSNAALYGLQYGELGFRAGTFNATNGYTKTISSGYLKSKNGQPLDELNDTISVIDGNINLNITHNVNMTP